MWCVIPICVTSPPHGGFSSKHSNLPTTLFGIHTANYQAKLSRILRRFFGSWIMNNSIFWKLGISLINWDTGLYHRTILWSIRLSIDNFPGLWYLRHIDPPPPPPPTSQGRYLGSLLGIAFGCKVSKIQFFRGWIIPPTFQCPMTKWFSKPHGSGFSCHTIFCSPEKLLL